MAVRSSDYFPAGALTTVLELQAHIDRAKAGEQVVLFTHYMKPLVVASTSFIGSDPSRELHNIEKAPLSKDSVLKFSKSGDYLELHYGGGTYWTLYSNVPVLPWPREGRESFIFPNWLLAWAEQLRESKCK